MVWGRARLCAALVAAAVLAPALAGCSSAGRAKGDTLVYWATQQSGSIATDRKLLTAELQRFTTQTGITVHLEIPTWPTLYTKILTAISSGQGPDVLNIGNTWSAALQATGAFLPFDATARRAIGGADRFVASARASTGAPGKTPVAVPLYGEVYALFYNRAQFRQAGIARPPATWAELIADGKKLTGHGRWGLALPGAPGVANAHFAFIFGRQHGADLFAASGRPTIDSDAEQAAVQQYVGLLSRYKVVDPSSAEHDIFAAQQEVAKGRAAMTFAQNGATTYFAALGFSDYGVAPIPSLQPLPRGGAAVESMVGGTNIAVFKDSPHRAAALELIKFLTSNAEQVRLNRAYSSLPVIQSAYADPTFRTPTMTTFRAVLAQHAEPMPMVADEAKMEAVLGDSIAQLWAKAATSSLTDADVAAALHDANRKLGG